MRNDYCPASALVATLKKKKQKNSNKKKLKGCFTQQSYEMTL